MSSPKDRLHIAARTYRLRYVAEEDRLLLSADFSAEKELALPLTRRITRKVVAALAKFMAERSRVGQDTNPLLRDTVLEFEHSNSVAKALAEGKMRTEKPPSPDGCEQSGRMTWRRRQMGAWRSPSIRRRKRSRCTWRRTIW